MTVHTLLPPGPRARLTSPADLVDALGVPFSDEQLTAICAPLEPGVIIAGAGSGKTTVMAARVVWLVGSGAVRPEEVLGLTFTRKAAAELSGRVRAALLRAGVVADRGVDEAGEQVVLTYDAFAGRLVAEHGLRLGYESDPTMISGATRYRLAARVVRAAAGPFEYLSRLRPATVTERVLKLDSDLQQHLVSTEALDPHARDLLLGLRSAPPNARGNVAAEVKRAMLACEERLELASLVQDYQALKRRLGVVEFADQMAIAARLAAEVPAVGRALRAAFRVVLLDEYQDTSAAQAAMLRGLFSGRTPSEGLGHPVTAVGDPFQAIYGWRGAAASNILSFAAEFRRADGRPAPSFALTVNRRSGPEILAVANLLSAPLRAAARDATPVERGDVKRAPVADRAVEDRAVEDGAVEDGAVDDRAVEDGAVEDRAGVEGAAGTLRAAPGARPAEVRAATFDTWPEEVTWIADQIVATRAAGTVPAWADIAVLTRRNADIAPIYAELTAREVPVEIVGLGGLLHLPEVMDVTATLRLVDDVTANPDLVRLLTGPRWRIGPRDLALLGRRARELARQPGRNTGSDEGPPAEVLAALQDAVADVDPSEVVSLLDALESPGDLGYDPRALTRFGALAAELAQLRRHADEPVLDLTRRVIATSGLDVELGATPEFARSNRRDQLGAFLDAVAGYVDVDGDASLSGLLAYLQAEIDQGAGLEQVVPSDREAVKLLTVHRAKGLEWEVVFLPALVHGVFPSDRVTDNWVTSAHALPADLRGDADAVPQLADTTATAIAGYAKELRGEQLKAEDRLGYVAVTRAKRVLVGTGHTWRPDLVRPRVPSAYLSAILSAAAEQGRLLAEAGPPAAANPMVLEAAPRPWPAPLDPDAAARRAEAAALVAAARDRAGRTGRYEQADADPLPLDEEAVVSAWDADLDRLLAEARQARSGDRPVPLPSQLSASAVLRVRQDPDGYAADLARPMPRPPSRAARFGTRFHQWVERHVGAGSPGGPGQQHLIDADDLPDRADAGHVDEETFRALCDAFAAGAYGARLPVAVEAPFSLALGGRLVRGRIDAVYAAEAAPDRRPNTAFQVVDWKTSLTDDADPWQLAIYRLAWAEVQGVPVEQVDAVFYYVRRDRIVRPEPLAGREDLDALLLGGVPPGLG